MSRIRAALAVGALAVAALAAAPAAWANGDPASHVLLVENVFYPGKPISQATTRVLDGLTAESKRKGYPVKVALIESRTDLGLVPSMLGRPQAYADLLRSEISFGRTWPLLVVMKNGLGASHTGPGTRRALAGLEVPPRADSETLARVAVDGVQRLAAAAGHPLEPRNLPLGGPAAERKGGAPVWLLGAPVVLVALLALVAGRRQRRAEQ
jgi:hypothetical protein